MAASSRIFLHPDPKMSSSPLAQLVVRLVQPMVGPLRDLGRLWLHHTSLDQWPTVADRWVKKASLLGLLWLQPLN